MTNSAKRTPGRPPNKTVEKANEMAFEAAIKSAQEQKDMEKIGRFVVITNAQNNSQRYNLEKIRTYGKGDTNIVSLVWDNGLATSLTFGSAKEADAVVELLDKHCL